MGPDLSARLEKSYARLRTVLLVGIAAMAIHLAMILWATLSLHIALRWSETDPMDLDMPGVRWGLALFLSEAVVLGLVVYRFLRWARQAVVIAGDLGETMTVAPEAVSTALLVPGRNFLVARALGRELAAAAGPGLEARDEEEDGVADVTKGWWIGCSLFTGLIYLIVLWRPSDPGVALAGAVALRVAGIVALGYSFRFASVITSGLAQRWTERRRVLIVDKMRQRSAQPELARVAWEAETASVSRVEIPAEEPPLEPATAEGALCRFCQAPAVARCGECGAVLSVAGLTTELVLATRPGRRTYLARSPTGLRVVLKEMVYGKVLDAKAVDAFEREGKLLRSLCHPRIPRYIDSFSDGEGPALRQYLVQTYIDGHDLAEELALHRHTPSEVLEIAGQVLEVLAYLHERRPPVLHRDIKPHNLLRGRDGSIHLVDFGVGRMVACQGTFDGTLVGTPGYMPPEQLAGQADVTADLYALGATLIHLLTRSPPVMELRDGVALDTSALDDHPRAQRRFLQRLTARRPADRFPDAKSALLALERVSGSLRGMKWW